jgi:hypothetical protein
MIYPFTPKKRPLAPWQRQFVGCCAEREWHGAASLLKRHAAERPDAIGPGEFPDAVVLFICEAPEAALAASGLPFPRLEYESRRTALHEKLLEAHMTRARFHVSKTRYGEAYHSLSAGLALHARNVRQEALVTCTLEEIAAKIARAERPHVLARPDIEEDAATLAPHSNDLAIEIAQLHPCFFPSLAAQALSSGMSDGALVAIFQLIFSRLHWPTWRALALVSDPAQAELRELASRFASESNGLAPGAAAHLRAFVEGQPFSTAQPTRPIDDVDF